MYIRAITIDKEFDKAKNEWMNFEKKVNNQNITSSYVWQRTWWKHFKNYEPFGHDKKLCILFLYNEKNELRAIAPFCEVVKKIKKLKYKTIEFITQQWGATYLDIISNGLSKEKFNFIFDWLKKNKKYDLIELKYIPQFTPNFDLYKSSITVLSGCPEIKIREYKKMKNYIQKNYSKSLRKNLQTAKNRIKRENINYHEEIISIANNDNFEKIKNVSQSKLKDNKYCVYNDSRKKIFLENIYQNPEFPNNIIKIILNNKLVSYRINFIYNKHKYCLDASYDRTYRHYDMGALSVNANIQDSFNKNLSTHCMGTGIDSYKLKFSKRITRIYTFLKRENSLKGTLLYIIKRMLNQKIENNFLKKLKINMHKN